MTERTSQISTRAYLEDTVTLPGNPDKLGVVTRTWHDVEDESAVDDADSDDDGEFGMLSRGHVQVSFLDNSRPLVVSEASLTIVDRSLHLGDVVKRRPEDMMSGIVTCGKMKLSLEHTFTGQKLENVDSIHVRSAMEFQEDQYILYDRRWVGEIDEVAADVTIRLSNNSLVQISYTKLHELELANDLGHPVVDHGLVQGDKFVIGQHVVTRRSVLRNSQWILGEFDPKVAPHGIVVDVRTKSVTVNWVAQRYQATGNQPINAFIQPNPFVYPGEDHVVVLSDVSDSTSHQIGDRVRFLDRMVETGMYGAQRMDRRELGGFDGNVWMVIGTNTIVDIDWQDGTTSENMQAKDLRMYLNVDEYEGWPGEFVSQEGTDQGPRVGIIQSVMPQERVARIRFFDEGELLPKVEEISLYDLNAHPILQYSLGDHVLIRSKLLPPGGVVDEVISLATGLVQRVVRSVRAGDDQPSGHQRQSSVNTEAVDWMGEVVKINTDGTVKVRLAREADPPPEWPGERFVTVKAEDVIVFEGDSDEEEDDLPIFDSDDWIDDDEGFDEEEDEEIENENENENENEQDNHNSEDEWEDASSASDEIPEASLDGMSDVEQAEHAQPVTVNGHIEPESAQMDSVGPVAIQETAVEEPAMEPTTQDERYPRFDILESVPSDHPFKSDNPRRSGGEWLARIRREHRILQSSLPQGIFVRTYESRLDLLRVLIVGPENTPYENAPFLFDFSLAGNFPYEPPEAFFHSWTPPASNARINPNLYVEGRVCLSLLGTWHSHNDTESWTNKSTLLQLFLSIQSLVLTARPYYNEAGFQTHVGLDEALVNERLYSERAYFLSRGFVKWVLENAIEGLEDEVKYLYLSPDGPQRGKAVIEDGKRVIATSEVPGDDDGEWERGRVTRVSRGGLEVLKRTISALEGIVERNNNATTNSDAMN